MTKYPYASIPSQRVLVWLTIGLFVLFGIGLAGLMRFLPPPPADLSADQVAELYRSNPVRMKIGTILGMIAGGAFLPLTLVISIQMARLEKGVPIWALLQGLSGTLGAFLYCLSMLIFATAAFSPERPPEITLLIHEFGWLSLITPLSFFILQILGIIIVAFAKDEDDRRSAFPRWMGYFNVWTLVTSFGGPIAVLFKTGIFAWDGLLPFYVPFGVFSIWLPAMCYTLLRALRIQERGAEGVAQFGLRA